MKFWSTVAILFGVVSVASAQLFAKKTFSQPGGEIGTLRETLNEQLSESRLAQLNQEALLRLTQQSIEVISEQSEFGENLSKLVNNGADRKELVGELKGLLESLNFEPAKESELPEGFPTYTSPGVIEVKTYPGHRKVSGKQFFPLFNHIKRNDVSMTAPVEMKYALDDPQMKMREMAFFYGSSTTGNAGQDAKDKTVAVVDGDQVTVVATAVRGKTNDAKAKQAKRQLENWLKAHPEYVADGELKVMGYNSPFTRNSRSLFEVQIPIRLKAVQ